MIKHKDNKNIKTEKEAAKRSFPAVNISLLVISIIIILIPAEFFLRYRENRIAKRTFQEDKVRLDRLMGRSPKDMLNIFFFNGCIMKSTLIKDDPVLGYINVPNTSGYSIHVDGQANWIVPAEFDIRELNPKHKAASFRINSLGNRGPEMAVEKPADTCRVVFIGDSITFGYYVNEKDIFPSLVGKHLSSMVPKERRVEVINAGVSSLDATYTLAHLKRRVLSWSPDLIIWGFYINDIYDVGEREGDVLFPVRKLGWLRHIDRFALGRLVESYVFATSLGGRLGVDPENDVNKAVDKGWVQVEKDLAEAKRISEKHDIPLIVIIFPTAMQFNYPWTKLNYQERLKEICKKYGIDYIDLYFSLEKAESSKEKAYYFGDLIHPNENGHKAAASRIISYIRQKPEIITRLSRACQ
ncbi:MAG: hypothetical protein A2Z72_04045 [Omnitrophica bacterium RBG_13_46_9]|nr:MAG: hypothetical protein A2Z72_04045 [Omnitrophica bacterium RBG_13_46_9]